MFSVIKVLLFAYLATATLLPRNYEQAQRNLTRVSKEADGVIKYAPRVRPNNSNTTADLYTQQLLLNQDLQGATDELRKGPVLTAPQTGTLLKNLTNTLYPKFKRGLNLLIANKRNIVPNEFGTFETDVLKLFSTYVTSFGGEFVTKAAAPSKAPVSAISSSLSALASSGRSAYLAAKPSG